MQGVHIEWSKLDWKWIGTTLLALYGAGLSTYREVAARLEKRPRISASLSLSMVLMEGPVSTPYLQIRVENHGRLDAIFGATCTAIQVKGYDHFLLLWKPLVEVTFPHTLKPGDSFQVMNPLATLRKALVDAHIDGVRQIRARVDDRIGRSFYSDWQTADVSTLGESH